MLKVLAMIELPSSCRYLSLLF